MPNTSPPQTTTTRRLSAVTFAPVTTTMSESTCVKEESRTRQSCNSNTREQPIPASCGVVGSDSASQVCKGVPQPSARSKPAGSSWMTSKWIRKDIFKPSKGFRDKCLSGGFISPEEARTALTKYYQSEYDPSNSSAPSKWDNLQSKYYLNGMTASNQAGAQTDTDNNTSVSANHSANSTSVLRLGPAEILEIWVDRVLADSPSSHDDRVLLKCLVTIGVPPELRGEFWKRVVGNESHITPDLYRILLNRVIALRRFLTKYGDQYDNYPNKGSSPPISSPSPTSNEADSSPKDLTSVVDDSSKSFVTSHNASGTMQSSENGSKDSSSLSNGGAAGGGGASPTTPTNGGDHSPKRIETIKIMRMQSGVPKVLDKLLQKEEAAQQAKAAISSQIANATDIRMASTRQMSRPSLAYDLTPVKSEELKIRRRSFMVAKFSRASTSKKKSTKTNEQARQIVPLMNLTRTPSTGVKILATSALYDEDDGTPTVLSARGMAHGLSPRACMSARIREVQRMRELNLLSPRTYETMQQTTRDEGTTTPQPATDDDDSSTTSDAGGSEEDEPKEEEEEPPTNGGGGPALLHANSSFSGGSGSCALESNSDTSVGIPDTVDNDNNDTPTDANVEDTSPSHGLTDSRVSLESDHAVAPHERVRRQSQVNIVDPGVVSDLCSELLNSGFIEHELIKSFETISLDIHRTVPRHVSTTSPCSSHKGLVPSANHVMFYQRDMHAPLRLVLETFAVLRPDIGYVQGMAYIAAMFLFTMDEFSAFACFSNILVHRDCMFAFFQFDMKSISIYFKAFDYLFEESIPILFNKLCACGLTSDIFLVEWWFTLFTRALPFDVAVQVWDHFLLEGDIVLYQVALGMLRFFQEELESCSLDRCLSILSTSTNDHLERIVGEKFFAVVSEANITRVQLDELIKKAEEEYVAGTRTNRSVKRTIGDGRRSSPSRTARKSKHKKSKSPIMESFGRKSTHQAAPPTGAGKHHRNSESHLEVPLEDGCSKYDAQRFLDLPDDASLRSKLDLDNPSKPKGSPRMWGKKKLSFLMNLVNTGSSSSIGAQQ